jgi:hypothetical protein
MWGSDFGRPRLGKWTIFNAARLRTELELRRQAKQRAAGTIGADRPIFYVI